MSEPPAARVSVHVYVNGERAYTLPAPEGARVPSHLDEVTLIWATDEAISQDDRVLGWCRATVQP